MRAVSILAILGLLVVPFVGDSFMAYQLGLYLLFGIVGQGIALCWGRAGFLPLGQALFFGIGAYISGYALKTYGDSYVALIPFMLLAILIPGILAGIIGALVFSRSVGSGPYFSLITLAVSMVGFQLANSLEWLTGGFNGLTRIPGLPGIDTYETLYFVIVPALALSTLLVAYILRSPFGQLLAAISQNEERAQFFGFKTSSLKALAFGISAAIAGFAGALYAPHQGIVTPQAVGFLLSAELVIWTAVGGRSTLWGPVVGAVVIGFLASELRDIFQYWEIVVALVFIGVVLKFPDGIVGAIASVTTRLRRPVSTADGNRRKQTAPPREQVSETALVFEDIFVQVGPVKILDGLTFSLDEKNITCLIGPNGAGKTSVFNAMTGKLPIRAGNIQWGGTSVTGKQGFEMTRLGIGRKFQVPSVFNDLTISQNIDIAIWSNRLRFTDLFLTSPYSWTSGILKQVEDVFPFLKVSNKKAGDLSQGQRQMLEFAMTIMTEPALLLLDEPCAGLSTAETHEMIGAIEAFNAGGDMTTVIIEHDMQVVERLADKVLVMSQGRLLAEGSVADIKADPAVQAVYGGGTK
ncbi:MAG: hypothetical protein COB93_08505 [Sneathiella sp.]|nr:MAG: hypothetical protein COB93_08505 [Sneathiella sp.]